MTHPDPEPLSPPRPGTPQPGIWRQCLKALGLSRRGPSRAKFRPDIAFELEARALRRDADARSRIAPRPDGAQDDEGAGG